MYQVLLFLMHFITAQNGSGGWPLNVFLTPDIHPIFALCMIKDDFEMLLGKTQGLPNFIK